MSEAPTRYGCDNSRGGSERGQKCIPRLESSSEGLGDSLPPHTPAYSVSLPLSFPRYPGSLSTCYIDQPHTVRESKRGEGPLLDRFPRSSLLPSLLAKWEGWAGGCCNPLTLICYKQAPTGDLNRIICRIILVFTLLPFKEMGHP